MDHTSEKLEHFINYTFDNEGKFLIDQYGKILLQNIKNLDFEIQPSQNLIDFIRPYSTDINEYCIDRKIPTNSSYQGEFALSDKEEWFRLLISPLNYLDESLFLVQIFNISTEKRISTQLNKQKKHLEKEMLLRTQEIIMTDEAMASQGGFLPNFLRGLRHDLLSPITQLGEIINYYQKTSDPIKKEKAAGLISDCLLKLNNTARGFSDFVDLHFLPQVGEDNLAFNDIFLNTQSILESEIENSKVIFKIDFSEATHIIFNKNMMESIFYNILSNAIKFKSERAPIIHIKTYNKAQKIILTVEDNGIGIDLHKYGQYLFTPFKRANMNRPGAGIGLSLVKSILGKQGGSIKFESEPGVGSKVVITFLKK